MPSSKLLEEARTPAQLRQLNLKTMEEVERDFGSEGEAGMPVLLLRVIALAVKQLQFLFA